jgi:hypothetical protein
MKKHMTAASLGFAISMLAGATTVVADETVTTKTETTTYAGTVSEINPSSSTIILRSDASPSPVTYTYSKETSFVDMNGQTVTYEAVRNSPVRVEYSTDGDRRIVRRVVQTGPAVAAPGGVIREKTTRTETHD